jgi:hypothetical protein
MLRNTLLLSVLLSLTACSGSTPVANIPSPSSLPVAALPEVPNNPACSRKYVSVKLDTFQYCLVDGMHYIQVANILGYAGTLQAQSGSTEIWQWNNGNGGFLTGNFSNQKLVTKSQVGLVSE